ncbi:MAG: HAD-IC family P-type ATPase, partial [Nitrospirae bacterium]|nr:HAD-IC family P-type ATPase [Nitrospirota bacterium]
MKVSALSREEVLRTLVTCEEGLTEEEAGHRLREFGPNEIREERKTSLALKFARQFTHFLAILLWIGAGLALLSEYLHPGEGMLTLGLAIIGVIVINAIFTFIQEYRAEKSVEALRRLLPFRVKVVRDGKERELPAREVVPGDVIRLTEGDRVPADARLLASASLTVNNAPLTGESEPILLREDPAPGELIESPNIAFAGTTVVSGSGKAAVFATGMRTEFGNIARLTGTVEAGLSPLQKEIVKVTRLIAAIATITGVIFFGIGHFIGLDFWGNFIFAIGIIVANVQEGLLPTVTLALAMGSQRMARKKALIKTLTSVETLGSVTVICTDKTGTLTQNRMAVRNLWYGGEEFAPADLRPGNADPLLRVALLCNNARFADGHYTGDPTEVALLKTAREILGEPGGERIGEIPFDSDRKRMTTINRMEGRVHAFAKGAAESLIPLSTHLWLHGEKVPLDEIRRIQVMDACQKFMDRGLRVLGFAFRELNLPPHAGPLPAGEGSVGEALVALVVTLPLAIWLRVPTLWFLVPFAIITLTRRPYETYGLTWRNPGTLRFHLVTCALIFGGYALLHYAFARVVLDLRFVPMLPPNLLET